MSKVERENYSQDGQYFQNEEYKDDDSVSNVLDNPINDSEQDYKDADDLDPDDYEENDFSYEEEEEDETDLDEDPDDQDYEK